MNMDTSFEELYHEREMRHWWFCGRRDFIARLLDAVPRGDALLDVGCSGGALLDALRTRGFTNLTGIDISPRAVERCHTRGFTHVREADACALPFADNTFDIVVASDLLEHIADADRAMVEWYRVLKPCGRLLVFVPAHQWLWSYHDTINHHVKRYRYDELIACMNSQHLRIVRSGVCNTFLFLPIAGVRLLERLFRHTPRSSSGNLKMTPTPVNILLAHLLMWENRLQMRGVAFPCGVSIFAVGEKI